MDSKRLLIAMVISLGLLVAWIYFFGGPGDGEVEDEKKGPTKKVERKKGEGDGPLDSKKKPRKEKNRGVGKKEVEEKKVEKKKEKKPVIKERVTVVEGDLFVAEISSYGGVLKRFALKKEQYKEKSKGKLRPVDLVRTKQVENLPLKVTFHKSSFSMAEPQRWLPVRKSGEEWIEVREGEKHVRKTKTGALEVAYKKDLKGSGVVLTKVFTLSPSERYHFDMVVGVENITSEPKKVKMTVAVPTMDFGEKGKSFFQPISLKREAICYVNGEVMVRTYDHIRGKKEDGCMGGCGGCACRRTPAESNSFAGDMKWGGIDETYFLLAVAPLDFTSTAQCRFGGLKTPRGGLMWTDMNFPEETVGGKKAIKRRFVVYAGPKDVDLLAKAGEGNKLQFDESVDFGILWFFGKPMLWLMRFFYRFVGNWGVAIILITILIKLATLYWNTKSMRSMKEMQKLKPLMEELKEKYGEDKQRYQQEMAKLWKRHKINPLGGCLPMVFQMPIYIAWYQALMAAVELYRAPFFGWIDDLTSPDPYYIMPIVMGAAMFGQQKMSPATSDNPQAKMMMYMMPAMFTFFMLFLPSGLTLYILVNVVLSMLHQWYLNHSQ